MIDKRFQTCCFTGHRDLPKRAENFIEARTEYIIRELINKGVKYFGVGGAIGYDTLAARVLFRMREHEFPNIKIILVYPFDGFTKYWTAAQQEAFRHQRLMFDKIVRVSETPSRDAYLKRDRHLVDCSGHCICYLSKSDGGTAYTVEYAKRKGLKVYNTFNPNDYI